VERYSFLQTGTNKRQIFGGQLKKLKVCTEGKQDMQDGRRSRRIGAQNEDGRSSENFAGVLKVLTSSSRRSVNWVTSFTGFTVMQIKFSDSRQSYIS
jgi:hypothetical protein